MGVCACVFIHAILLAHTMLLVDMSMDSVGVLLSHMEVLGVSAGHPRSYHTGLSAILYHWQLLSGVK